MTKRYREPVEVDNGDRDPSAPPAGFRWRGAHYRVLGVIGHWREDAGFWSGGQIDVPQRDLWRVEASGRRHGVYELVHEGGRWRLDRVWD